MPELTAGDQHPARQFRYPATKHRLQIPVGTEKVDGKGKTGNSCQITKTLRPLLDYERKEEEHGKSERDTTNPFARNGQKKEEKIEREREIKISFATSYHLSNFRCGKFAINTQ